MHRMLHELERRYLALDAQAFLYQFLASSEVPGDIAEKAINEAVAIGQLRHQRVDADLFVAVLDAVFLDERELLPRIAEGEGEEEGPQWIC